jgi:hypothetical protein
VRYRYDNDISEAIAMQGWIRSETICRPEERGRTAKRRWGFVIPVSALALLIADIAMLAVTVAQ